MNLLIFSRSVYNLVVFFIILNLNIPKSQGDIYDPKYLHNQRRQDLLKDFRPSQPITEVRMVGPENPIFGTRPRASESQNFDTNLKNHKEISSGANSHNHEVSQRSPDVQIPAVEQKTESSIVQGRVFGGHQWSPGSWGGGGGGHQCQHLNTYNPGCCRLGYSNCCNNGGHHGIGIGIGGGWQGGGGHRYPPPPVQGNSWGSGKGKGQPHFQPQFPHNHNHGYPPIQPIQPYRPQGFFKPRPPTQGWSGGGNFQKPGSCYYNKPSFSILNKFKSIFSKGKSLDHSHGYESKGWGWNPFPPSQNAGYYFHRRSDNFQDINDNNVINKINNLGNFNKLTKRQLAQISDNFQNIENKNNNKYNLGNNYKLTKRQLDLSPENPNKKDYFAQDEYLNDGGIAISHRDEKSLGASFPAQSYGQLPYNYNGYHNHNHNNVGIGSLTGRIIGGWGWNSGITTGWTVTDPNVICYSDYECPGHQKCCGGVCKTPSLLG